MGGMTRMAAMAMAMAMVMAMAGAVAVKEGGGLMCHHPQRQLGGGGVMLQPCLPTCVYSPMMRTHMTTTTTQ
jgi:hypothetical protein